MKTEDIFIGQRVRHVRGELEGTITELIEQPDPFPLHATVRTASGTAIAVPINQLIAVADV